MFFICEQYFSFFSKKLCFRRAIRTSIRVLWSRFSVSIWTFPLRISYINFLKDFLYKWNIFGLGKNRLFFFLKAHTPKSAQRAVCLNRFPEVMNFWKKKWKKKVNCCAKKKTLNIKTIWARSSKESPLILCFRWQRKKAIFLELRKSHRIKHAF